MKRRYMIFTAAALTGALLFSACGSGENASQPPQQESTQQTAEAASESAKEATPEPAKEATPEPTKEATPEPTKEATPEPTKEATPAPTEEATPEPTEEASPAPTEEAAPEAENYNEEYAWLGMAEMPKCDYMDTFATFHYISTYDNLVMGLMVEETEAVDLINSVKTNSNTRSYSLNGMIYSINEDSKSYMVQDITATADTAMENLTNAMATGENIYGRAYVGSGTEAIPNYEDDTAEYDYYEFDYPSYEEYGSSQHEKYYMKDGDVFAVYSKTTLGKSEVESLKIIKSMSGDIPEGTFDEPDLTGYELIEL